MDLVIEAEITAPNAVQNFFGFGNEPTKGTNDKKYYRVRYHYYYGNPMARKALNENLDFYAGAYFIFGKVEDSQGRFISDTAINGLPPEVFEKQMFSGINLKLDWDTRDDETFPTRGIFWSTNMRSYYGLNHHSGNFVNMKSDLSMFFSFRKDPRAIFALRLGGGKSWGNYPFYFSQSIGGKTNLRGYQSNRFSGDASFYQNTEVRLKVLKLNTYMLTGKTGILLFNDFGRVWYEGEKSRKWHHGYGGGFWMTPFEMLTVSVNYNISKEEHFFDFHFSYLF